MTKLSWDEIKALKPHPTPVPPSEWPKPRATHAPRYVRRRLVLRAAKALRVTPVDYFGRSVTTTASRRFARKQAEIAARSAEVAS